MKQSYRPKGTATRSLYLAKKQVGYGKIAFLEGPDGRGPPGRRPVLVRRLLTDWVKIPFLGERKLSLS